MFRSIFAYLAFLIKSTNAHGVHSPFVYGFITKSLYGTPKRSGNRAEDMVLKSIAHFQYSHIRIVGNVALEQALQANHPSLQFEGSPVDLIYFENPSTIDWAHVINHYSLHNDSVIVLPNIRGSAASLAAWRRGVDHPEITVSVDFFHTGLAFIRKEQVKQHFYIRY